MQYPDVYNNDKRYVFNNWSKEDFICKWGGIDFKIKAGETKEYNMSTAFHLTKHLVDREMNREGKSHLLGVDEERKIYEDKTLAEIGEGVESPALANLKEQIKKETEEANVTLVKKTKAEAKKKDEEFADIK